ncbi:DUF5979 domain-containing protein [Corynebacterium epidermidicanis]|nr:DUF5979 domain-containing protein [Corynebacterium epidermidicanis]
MSADAATPSTPATNMNYSGSDWQYGDCSFRSGTNDAATYADELCWIDMKEAASLSTPQTVTKNLGRYTLTYTLSLTGQSGKVAVGGTAAEAQGPGVSTSFGWVDNTSAFGNTIDGTTYFAQYAGDPNKPVVKTSHDSTSARVYTFKFDNIKLVDKFTGATVANPRFVVADAQQTAVGTGSEVLTVHSSTAGVDAIPFTRLTPSTYTPACSTATSSSNIFGPAASSVRYGLNQVGPVDFACYEYNAGVLNSNSTKAGTYLVGATAATALEISTYSWSTQAWALAIDFGRMRGDVTADTQQEQLATGQVTDFDFKMGVRSGTTTVPAPWQGPNTYTQVARSINSPDLWGKTSSDQQIFTSTASGAQSSEVFKRYDPVWTCTLATTNTVTTIKPGSVPAGYTLTNDPATKTSELAASNPQNEPITCVVKWTPKFISATLDLSKIVSGDARTFAAVTGKTFTINYDCVPPHDATKTDQQARDEFSTAYPNVPLTGTYSFKSGDSAQISGLPSGATCKVTEKNDAILPTDAGVDHTLTWTGGITQPGTAPELNSVTVVLQPVDASGSATKVIADNNYKARLGRVVLSKTVTGDPVDQTFGTSKTYRFDLNCPGTTYRRTVDLVLNAVPGSPNTLSGSTTIDGVPVAQNCTLTPLTGLSIDQQKTVKFDGRKVNIDGNVDVQPNSFGAYPLVVPNYAQGTTLITSQVNIAAHYSWKTAPVKVIKQVSGPAAELAKNTYATYPVSYECTLPNDSTYRVTGKLDITTDSANPVQIPDVRIDAQCKVWEEATPEATNFTLDRTDLVGSDANDQATHLSNDQAKTQPILTVIDSTDPGQNRVVVTNHYVNKLGTVNLTKLVQKNGITTGIPSDYDILFECGTRSYETANGIQSAALTGKVRVSENGTVHLVATNADPAVAAMLNDALDGSMQVPYGNTCSFSEPRPNITAGGINWTADVADQTVTVQAPDNAVSVTNTYTPAGDGITISRNVALNPELSGPLDYVLTCTNIGLPLTLPGNGEFTLADGDSISFTPAEVPQGSQCQLQAKPLTADKKTRTINGVTFPVTWITETTYPSDASGTQSRAQSESEGNLLNISGIVVGNNSVVTINNQYDYLYSNVTASKTVQFPQDPQSYISDERKAVKKDRQFTVRFRCTYPDGNVVNLVGTIVDGATSATEVNFTSQRLPIGATCSATEDISQTATGIDLKQEVKLNGSNTASATASAAAPATFTIKDGQNTAEFINSYTRRLAPVELNKIANTPIDLSAYYGQFFTHTFEMTCVDPLAADRPVLGVFTGTIHGPGSTTFQNVPVGTECTITGDNFGRLDLKDTQNGVDLETHLRPESVDWTLDRNDASSEHDTTLSETKTTTTSMGFEVLDNAADGGSQNVVNLTNNYAWVTAPVEFSKTVVADSQVMDLLENKQPEPTFDFTYKCEGVGYNFSAISTDVRQGTGENLPRQIPLGSFGAREASPDGSQQRVYPGLTGLEVPSGAWCTVTESGTQNTPAGVKVTTTVNGTDSTKLSQRISENDSPTKGFDFVNKYEREMVPTRIVTMKDGYFQDADPAGYSFTITCDDAQQTTITEQQLLSEALVNLTTADPAAPAGGHVVMLPAGSNCTITADNASPALAPLASLAVTQGDRRPFMLYGSWIGETPSPSNPQTPANKIPVDQVTTAMKSYTYSFAVPAGATPTDTGEVMTIAADVMYPIDHVDVTFVKEVAGSSELNPTFEFSSNCFADGTFTLQAGQTKTLPQVAVNQNCFINEESDGIDGLSPVLTVTSAGDRLSGITEVNNFVDPANPDSTEQHSIGATVLPVESAATTTANPADWRLVALNTYPGLKINKKIDGSPISSITGAIADTALLPHTADRMHFTYTATNTGAMDISNVTLTEPALAGRTVVAADGTQVVIDANGTIPANVCAVVGQVLTAGTEKSCSFDVLITEPNTQNFTYAASESTVTIAGTTKAGSINATDKYGAFRPMESLAWVLPETGRQTLVYGLLIGLALLAFGLWRRYRETKDDDES